MLPPINVILSGVITAATVREQIMPALEQLYGQCQVVLCERNLAGDLVIRLVPHHLPTPKILHYDI